MKKIKVFNIDTKESFIYEKISEAAKATGRAQASIHKVLSGKTNKSGRYFFTCDLEIEEVPVVLPKNFKVPDVVSERRKELRKKKVNKEEAKRELQRRPVIYTGSIQHLVEKVTFENDKRVLHLKSTQDQWSHLENS
jgi:hypothetical protein